MVTEIRVNGTKIEFEDDELAATRTLKELSDGTYIALPADILLTTPIIASLYQDAGKTKLMTIPNAASDTLATVTNVATAKTALKKNGMICFAPGFIINGSSATLVDTAGTADKCYASHLSCLKTHWFDFPKIPVPSDYDGGSIDITVCFRSAATGKKHSLGIRVASVATTEPHNPDLAAAFQLYNETVSGDTIGDVTILKTTVTQANHLMVAGEIWHCKFVVEDDAGCDADAILFDWIRIEWNKV